MNEDVLEVAQKYLERVKRSGPENITALCPFHDNRDTPSFAMNLTNGLYYCFSCGARGNLSTFLRGVGLSRSFIEFQYRFLLEELGRGQSKKRDPLREQPYEFQNKELPEALLGLFDKCPLTLVEEDHFDEGLLQQLDVGFDEKHMRITFPLRDMDGRLVGISGRAISNEQPKYKVYDLEYKEFGLAQHRTFKSQLLWNGHLVYPQAFLFHKTSVIVVEGFKACMRLIQNGLPNTVAILSAFVSDVQRQYIERIASEMYIMLDDNAAGLKGTVNAGMKMGIPVKVVPYPAKAAGPKGLQPSDLNYDELMFSLSLAKDFHIWLQDTPEALVLYKERRNRIRQRFVSEEET